MKRELPPWLTILIAGAALAGALLLADSKGVGQEPTLPPQLDAALPDPDRREPDALLPPETATDEQGGRAEAPTSVEPHVAAQAKPSPVISSADLHDAEEQIARGAVTILPPLEDLAEPMQPTAEGFAQRYVELWTDESFLTLSADEARELLPLDEDTFSGTISVVSLLGGLPTRDECDRAFLDPEVQGLLSHACLMEAEILAIAEIPTDRRSKAYASVVEAAEANWQRAEKALMRRLDEVSSYKNWRALWSLWEAHRK